MTSPSQDSPQRRLSDIVKSLEGSPDLKVGDLMDSLGERAFGALMFIFAVPNVIPTPPGTSAILGLPLVILTAQLMVGRITPWLPEAVRRRVISKSLLETFVARVVPIMAKIERFLEPRLPFLVTSLVAERVMGLVAFLLSVILFLPVPFANMLPGAAIALMALGLAERDGIAAVAGYVLAAATGIVLLLVSSALYAAVAAFFTTLFG